VAAPAKCVDTPSCSHRLSSARPVKNLRRHQYSPITAMSVYLRTRLTTGIETYLHAGGSHKLLLLQHLENGYFVGLADNEVSGCSRVVGADLLKQGYLRAKYEDNLCRVVSLSCSFFPRQLRSPLGGFVGFASGFIEVHEFHSGLTVQGCSGPSSGNDALQTGPFV